VVREVTPSLQVRVMACRTGRYVVSVAEGSSAAYLSDCLLRRVDGHNCSVGRQRGGDGGGGNKVVRDLTW